MERYNLLNKPTKVQLRKKAQIYNNTQTSEINIYKNVNKLQLSIQNGTHKLKLRPKSKSKPEWVNQNNNREMLDKLSLQYGKNM